MFSMYAFSDQNQDQTDKKKLCSESYLATPAVNILIGLKVSLIKNTLFQVSHTSVHGLIQRSAS